MAIHPAEAVPSLSPVAEAGHLVAAEEEEGSAASVAAAAVSAEAAQAPTGDVCERENS